MLKTRYDQYPMIIRFSMEKYGQYQVEIQFYPAFLEVVIEQYRLIQGQCLIIFYWAVYCIKIKKPTLVDLYQHFYRLSLSENNNSTGVQFVFGLLTRILYVV